MKLFNYFKASLLRTKCLMWSIEIALLWRSAKEDKTDPEVHFFFFAVLADSLKALAVGAPLEPGLRIFSPDPSAIRLRLA
jgi:hypothetical protein